MSSSNTAPDFEQRYQSHLEHIRLKGLRPKTIDAYARARYTHLSSTTGEQASARIDALMARFTLDWAGVR